MLATVLHKGTVVDRYTVEDRIGEGGMAVVYRVRHNVLGTAHALKVLTLASPQIRARLEREGQMQASLRHPNIVAVTDVIEVGGATALVLELVDGPALDAVLRARRLTFEEIDLLVPGILAGVAAAHQAGYVHRDLKPANVLLARIEGGLVPKVGDFGLAKGVTPSDPGGARTRTGSTMGTPQYMSPEQVRDTKGVGPPSDVFALGALLYEMVTGRRAFDGDDLLDIFNAVAAARYTPVAELVPDVPDRMVRAIDAALQVDPSARPSVVELAALWGADLRAVAPISMSLPAALAGAPAPPAVPGPNAPRTPETWTSAAPATTPPPAGLRLPASRALWALGLGGTLVALGAVGLLAVGLGLGGWWWFVRTPPVVVVPVSVPVGPAPAPAPPPSPDAPLEPPAVPGELEPVAPVEREPRSPPAGKVPPTPPAEERGPGAEEAGAEPIRTTADPPDRDPTIPEVPPPAGDPPPAVPPQQVADVPEPPVQAAPQPAPAPRVPEAFGMLASDDPQDRIRAAENLADRINDPDAPARLFALVRSDPHPEVREVAADLVIALYLDAHGDLEPAVVWLMANGPEGSATRAVDAYRERGGNPEHLRGALAHPHVKVRLQALRALPQVAPRAPDDAEIDCAAMVRPLTGDDQPAAVRKLAEETLRRL